MNLNGNKSTDLFSFPWQMVFTTSSATVFPINSLHVSLFLPSVTHSHFAKYNTIEHMKRVYESRFQPVSDIYCRGGQVGPASQIL